MLRRLFNSGVHQYFFKKCGVNSRAAFNRINTVSEGDPGEKTEDYRAKEGDS